MVGFGKGKNKILSLDPAWVKWLEDQINLMAPNEAILAIPRCGLVYIVDKSNKKATLVAVPSSQLDCDTRRITERIFRHLNFDVTIAADAVKQTYEELAPFFIISPDKKVKIVTNTTASLNEIKKLFQ